MPFASSSIRSLLVAMPGAPRSVLLLVVRMLLVEMASNLLAMAST